MRGIISKAVLCAVAIGWTSQAQAFVWNFNDQMDGLQEVPPNASPATGLITGTYDDVTNMLDIQWTFENLTSAQTNAHIHKGERGVAGGVVFPLPLGSPGVFQATLTDAQELDLMSELYYINIHTQNFPSGEIRGQMVPVPEPACLAAIGVAIAALSRNRRSSRR